LKFRVQGFPDAGIFDKGSRVHGTKIQIIFTKVMKITDPFLIIRRING